MFVASYQILVHVEESWELDLRRGLCVLESTLNPLYLYEKSTCGYLFFKKVIELHSSRHEGAFGKSCRNWYHALDSVTEKLYSTFVAILLTICGTPNTDMPLLLHTLPSSSFYTSNV